MTETYSVTSDFGGTNPRVAQFNQEILDSSIAVTLNSVSLTGDSVLVVFASTISGAEKTTLDGLAASHIPDNTFGHDVKGTITVANGTGGTSVLTPGADNQVMVADSGSVGAKYVNLGGIMPTQSIKATAPTRSSTNNNSYEVIMVISVKGENISQISSIDAVSYKTGSSSSYDIRVYDATNSLVIAEANFANSNSTVVSLGTLSNLPTGSAIFEIQAKKNGGNNQSYTFVEEITIEYQPV